MQVQKRKAANEINLSIFNNDLPGDISGVTAGNGLTGGGTTGTVTLNVGAGTGIDVSADAIAVDVSDFMSNGVNNRLLTATGADAMNAEANLTFDGSTLTVTGTAAATTFSGSGASLTNIPNGALDNSAITINGTSTALGGSINVGDITGVTAGTLLDGGGTTGTVTLNVGLSELTTSTSDGDGDFFAVVDAANAQKKLTKGNINISGFNNDSGFIDGSSLNASNLDSGTVPDARFPATLPALNGSALTALNATQLTSGTVPDARFPATLPALNGSALTNLNATALASGTVANARLDAQLQDVAGLAVTDGNFIVGNGSNFVAESGATARTSLGLGSIATLNTVTLTTNTTGNYVASLTAGALIDVGAAGEGATPSIAVDLSEATDMTEAMVGTDEFIVLDAGSQKRKAANEINLSIFNNDLPGDISGVTAGNGLTGGGTTGTVTLNVGAGTGIDVSADAIDVDLSELTTSTSDADGDFFVVVDSVNAQKKLTKGNINISGFNNDSGFIDGSSLNADNLSSGTVPDARFPATLPAASGANLTALNATQLTSGTVPDARFPATLPALNGSAL